MNLREAAQQALEALEMSTRFVYADNRPQCENAINALRAALAEDVPETNFGNMAQSVNSIEANHIPDATKMVEECAYPECLSTNGCEKQCPAFPRSKDDHILDAEKMVATINETETVEPVAWMVYTLDGKSAFITDNPEDFTPEHKSLPLYTAPPKREPLTDEDIDALRQGEQRLNFVTLREFRVIARAIERAHGIGGEE